jgi:hypothetical protein
MPSLRSTPRPSRAAEAEVGTLLGYQQPIEHIHSKERISMSPLSKIFQSSILATLCMAGVAGCSLTRTQTDSGNETQNQTPQVPVGARGINWDNFFSSTDGVGAGLVPTGTYQFARCFQWNRDTGLIDFNSTLEFVISVAQVAAEPKAEENHDHPDGHLHEEQVQAGSMLLKKVIVKNNTAGTASETYVLTDLGDYDNHLDHFLVGSTKEPAIGTLDRLSFSAVPVNLILDDKALLQVPKEFRSASTWQFNSILTLSETENIKIPGQVSPIIQQKTKALAGIGCEMKNSSWRLSIRTTSGSSHGSGR